MNLVLPSLSHFLLEFKNQILTTLVHYYKGMYYLEKIYRNVPLY